MCNKKGLIEGTIGPFFEENGMRLRYHWRKRENYGDKIRISST